MSERKDIVVRFVPGYGWLGLVELAGVELYRTGGFHAGPESALAACLARAPELWGTP